MIDAPCDDLCLERLVEEKLIGSERVRIYQCAEARF